MRPPRYYDQDFRANGGRINGVPLYEAMVRDEVFFFVSVI